MHNFLTEVTADCTDVLVVKPQKVMPNPGRKNQIVHTFEDGRNAVVAVSNTSIFEVELQWTYVSEADRSTIFELFHASAKANGSARSFYWLNPVDGYVYTVRFLTPLRTVYKPGSLRSVETVRLRVEGRFGDHEYIIDLGDLHLATVDDGAMFFHDTEDFSVYAGASGDTPFRIIFTDSGGLTAEAWCGEVGGGLDYGGELIPDPTCATDFWDSKGTGWSHDSLNNEFDCDGSQTSGSDLQENNTLYVGYIYTAIYTIKNKSAGYLQFVAIGAGATLRVNNGTFTDTLTTTGANPNRPIIFRADVNFIGSIDDLSVKQVTDIPATGLKLYSTQDGTTQSMGTTEAGFNPNTIKKVDIYG